MTHSQETILHTRPDIFEWDIQSMPYERVIGLTQGDTTLGQKSSPDSERVLDLAENIGCRLMTAFSAIQNGQPVNCHMFSRYMQGLHPTPYKPRIMLYFEEDAIQPIDTLPPGEVELVVVDGLGARHSIGYGLGDEGLQVLSERGELGIATHNDVVRFYAEYCPGGVAQLMHIAGDARRAWI